MTSNTATTAKRYVTVITRSGETAHLRIRWIGRQEGYLLLEGYVEHRKRRSYLRERIFAQVYFIKSDDEYHDADKARLHIKADSGIELKKYTPAEWSDITNDLNFAYEADKDGIPLPVVERKVKS
jgi:hypothetical protein